MYGMSAIAVDELMKISRPVMELFATVEPLPWTRQAILLELVGEVGSLAHLVQHWEGFKRGRPGPARLEDECSDVLFILLRLAEHDRVALHPMILIEKEEGSAADQVLALGKHASHLQEEGDDPAFELMAMLTDLGQLADCVGIDLSLAHRREMEIALYYFKASGDRWPRPQLLHHPAATFHLARLLWNKRNRNRITKDI
jgi:NTP pyrophosphatase (non-canonical NTP hydrolase)